MGKIRKKTRNPLRKRVLRELAGEWTKYLLLGVFLILMIGFVSGVYVANGSMMKAIDESAEKYLLEDGYFELDDRADSALLDELSTGELPEGVEAEDDFCAVPVELYETFYRNEAEDHDNDGTSDGTVRVYRRTDAIDQACVLSGNLPEHADEIAIDRMHADNVNLTVGDEITVGGISYRIVGLIAYVNYSTLHEKATDLMFDALKFDVAMVTEDGFERLTEPLHYAYAWKYETAPADEIGEKEKADDLMQAVLMQSAAAGRTVENFVPRYQNPAINFAPDDMGSDEAMSGVLLYVLILILAFIFAVTITNTITKEASVIGTLRASGYTKGELVRHYLTMPVIVTLVAALIGNVLGYTVFKNVVVGMYYNSYSLVTYETVWNAEAFVRTTAVPLILMFAVNLIVIVRAMQRTPLQFFRHDLKKSRRKKAMRIPRWKFMNRFRLRIILQNLSGYAVLFVGILFVMVMLAFTIGMPSTIDYYQEHAPEMMFADYQYVLKSVKNASGEPVTTENEKAEKFGMRALQISRDDFTEEISVYGVAEDSAYIQIDGLDALTGNGVYVSESFADKYGLAEGDTVTLDEKYEHKSYGLKVAGTYDQSLALAVFLPIENYRELFSLSEDAFSGYLSDETLEDLDTDLVASVITQREITKMCDQLDHSMGAFIQYFQVIFAVLSAVLLYLLTKLIIEKNEGAISMTKILGYENREIAGLYLFATTVMVVVSALVSVWLGTLAMSEIWRAVMRTYSGWYTFYMEPAGYVKMVVFVLIGYLVVMCFDYRRICRIPMDEALKNVE